MKSNLFLSLLSYSGFALLVSVLVLVAVTPSTTQGKDLSSCLPPPFLYVSFHGGDGKHDVNNIKRYSRDGCDLGYVIDSNDAENLDELRGMALIPASHGSDYLLVANSNEDDSRIVMLGACDPSNGNARSFLSNLVQSSSSNQGLVHPYAVRVHPAPRDYLSYGNSSVYVSNQDSGLITYYNLDNGEPRPVSAYLQNSGSYPSGSFAKIDQVSQASFRGIAFDNNGQGNLWAADDVSSVVQYDATTGGPASQISIDSPIGVDFFVVDNKELLFVSSNSNNNDDQVVYAYDPVSAQLILTYGPEKLDHPAGFVAYEDVLYVLSQNTQAIVAFNLTTGEYLDVINDNLPDQPEQVILAYC